MAQQDWNRAGPKYVIEVRKLSLTPHCLKKGHLVKRKLKKNENYVNNFMAS